jgi:hypothetical protein
MHYILVTPWHLVGLPKEVPPLNILDGGPLQSGVLCLGRPLSCRPVGLAHNLNHTQLRHPTTSATLAHMLIQHPPPSGYHLPLPASPMLAPQRLPPQGGSKSGLLHLSRMVERFRAGQSASHVALTMHGCRICLARAPSKCITLHEFCKASSLTLTLHLIITSSPLPSPSPAAEEAQHTPKKKAPDAAAAASPPHFLPDLPTPTTSQ